ncbi:MAG: riboflavin biosynthesis protein RibF [Planctomycetota bacterium]
MTRIVTLREFPPTSGSQNDPVAPFWTGDSSALGDSIEPEDAIELSEIRGGAVSIGNFDGVHRGHQNLLTRLVGMAKSIEGPSTVVVFDPHPASILRPESKTPRLTDLVERARRMSRMDVDFLLVCPATPRLLEMAADEFFDTLLVNLLETKCIVEGPNFFFGKDRGGDVHRLKQLCDGHGIDLAIIDPLLEPSSDQIASRAADDVELVSSSNIRGALTSGDVARAASMMGHLHRVRGLVVDGAKRGREIGFPTANLDDLDAMLPCPGVYSAKATLADGAIRQAAVNLGPNPTFEESGDLKFEVHLIDYSGSLYGQRLTIEFIDRVRDIQTFDSVKSLTEQLHQDLSTVRRQCQLQKDISWA